MLISWNTSFLYGTTLVINLWSIPCQLLFHLDITSHLELLWSLAMKSMNEEHTEANKPCIDHACSCRWWHHNGIMLMW
jgi:hypothetical protein